MLAELLLHAANGMTHLLVNHISLITDSLERVREKLKHYESELGPIETFPKEGTREFYAGKPNQSCRLLVQEPLDQNSSYYRALQKFGPGIHHLAVAVPDPKQYVAKLQGSGWYLLPASMRTADTLLWLIRPGQRFLIEVVRGPYDQNEPFVTAVKIPCSEPRLLQKLAIAADKQKLQGVETADELQLIIAGRSWTVDELLQP